MHPGIIEGNWRGLSLASAAASLCAVLTCAWPDFALADWNVSSDVRLRHDDNVGNSAPGYAYGNSILAAKLAISHHLAGEDGVSLSVAADLGGERYQQLTGLSNATIGGTLSLRKKWGLGPYTPWVRVAAGVARTNYDDGYRNLTLYRATASAGRRLDERWNLVFDFAYERRIAARAPDETPGVSRDAFSQTGRTLNAGVQYSCGEQIYLSAGLLLRYGDVTSTYRNGYAGIPSARAVADDPAFGYEAYAYRLRATAYGVKASINYAPAPHHLLGLAFSRFNAHAEGVITYKKSVPELRWDYSF